MRIAFMGSADFAVPSLRALHAAGHGIAAVYSQPPRPAGRGKADRPTPVAAAAADLSLSVRTPVSLKNAQDQADFAALDLEVAVVAAYGLILPQAILDAPGHGCLNLHGSLLPRWRGAAPIQRAVEAGDALTGVQLMRMEAGLDTGPVAMTARTRIDRTETAGELHDRLAGRAADLAVEGLEALEAGTLAFRAQEGEATYAHKIDKAEAKIDWSEPAERIARKINAFSPFPGAWFEANGQRVKVLRADWSEDAEGAPGAVLEAGDRLVIAAGAGAVALLELQKAGGKRAEAGAFLRGFKLAAHDRLT